MASCPTPCPWCQAALAWGAKQILFVAKHTGGFCCWQTGTTDYSIERTAWTDGKGDVLDELARSCGKHGLSMGIYVYPGDESWGAAIGSGGKTQDPARQEKYNEVFRTQLTEAIRIAARHTRVVEVWFDGSCVIEVGDILEREAPDAIVFQGTHAAFKGRILLGMALMKSGVFSGERSGRFYRGMALLGYGCGFPGTVLGAVQLFVHDYDTLRAPSGDHSITTSSTPADQFSCRSISILMARVVTGSNST